VGGITTAKKIAALAEARALEIVPHNPFSAVSTAACLQVAAAIPNLALLEYPGDDDDTPLAELVADPPRIENGYLLLPDTPGIGVELAANAHERFPPRPRQVRARLHADGSVVQQ
jgi:galactonate dehydratase